MCLTYVFRLRHKTIGCVSLPHPNCSLVTFHAVDSQPGGQVQKVLKNLLVQLQVGELTFPLQRAQVDLVR